MIWLALEVLAWQLSRVLGRASEALEDLSAECLAKRKGLGENPDLA